MMTKREKKLLLALSDWLDHAGINDDLVLFGGNNAYFEYDWDKTYLFVGLAWDGLTKIFSPYMTQFLHEYGMRDDACLSYPTLAFLHELGHYATELEFNEFEIGCMKFMKPECENYEDCEEYWLVPDELSAMTWAIWYVNNFPAQVQNLEDIMQKYWW
jgi:hypothetical protein